MIAMLFRAFLPSGWMPAPAVQADDAPWLSFVICTSEGLVQPEGMAGASFQDMENGATHEDTVHSYSSCPYGTAAPLTIGAASLNAVIYPTDFNPHVFHADARDVSQNDLFQRERSRAPPLLKS